MIDGGAGAEQVAWTAADVTTPPTSVNWSTRRSHRWPGYRLWQVVDRAGRHDHGASTAVPNTSRLQHERSRVHVHHDLGPAYARDIDGHRHVQGGALATGVRAVTPEPAPVRLPPDWS